MTEIVIGKDKERLWGILPNEKMFYAGGLKALNMTPEAAGLARCMKSYDNGRIKLSYDVSNYSPLNDVIGRMPARDVIRVVKFLTKSAVTVSNNGMMSLSSTLFNLDNVFVSGSDNSLSTRVIYLPLAVQAAQGDESTDGYFLFLRDLLRRAGAASAEAEFRALTAVVDSAGNSLEELDAELEKLGAEGPAKIESIVKDVPNLPPEPPVTQVRPGPPASKTNGKLVAVLVIQLCAVALAIAAYFFVGILAIAAVLAVDAIAVVIVFTAGGRENKKPVDGPTGYFTDIQDPDGPITEEFDPFTPTVRLVGQNTPMMLKYVVDKATFSIGRASSCDAIIPDSLRKISSHHCTIITENGNMFVEDRHPAKDHVGSRNGTFINGSGSRIAPDQRARIQINDTLQLANYRFKVEHL